ncbi:MAG: hypothetical protein LZF60_340117 [Nitrospira sp.]|nr:MAG: hypothetical protein LZF60_340117 [Nitrospira sp.]
MLGHSLQTKLQVNEPGDEYEQEADRVANHVMQTPDGQWGRSQALQSGPLVQRFVGDGMRSTGEDGALQRAETAGEESAPVEEQPASDEAAPKDGTTDEGGSRCPSWRNDPESISKRAAENYVQHDITPPSQAKVEKIRCEPPIANGNYGCYVHFSDGLVVRVIVRATDIVVGMGPGQIATETPPPATPLCFYDYHCPDGFLVLTKRECKSARPSKPHPPGAPTDLVQRRAVSEQPGSVSAPPSVQEVLASPGRPLDRSARNFFESRFGHDFGQVRVHADAKAAESARSVNALAYTVGRDVVFGAGQYSPHTRTGQRLLAHELAHVVQQTGRATSATHPAAGSLHSAGAVAAMRPHANDAHDGVVQRQPTTDGPALRDLPIFLERLEFDVGNNLLDYGHHLYQAAILHPDDPAILQNALSRYALGLNVLKDSYRFAGFKPDTADKLALGTGILFKSLTFIRQGELTLDFQVDIGHGVKFETNVTLGVNPKDVTDVQTAGVNVGLVRRF